ncbi:MAG: bacterioferritin [Calditrichia bacterium]
MRGNPDVLQQLNEVLTAELTAINQYFIHSEMCNNWGTPHLADVFRDASIVAMKSAEKIIRRILYLDGRPDMSGYMKIAVGNRVPLQLENDIKLVKEIISRMNKTISICRHADDDGSRHLLKELLKREEKYIDWLEAQVEQISQMGEANYLSRKMA